jgi:nucleoside-diphosphate kinase
VSERTLILVKPRGVSRALVGEVISGIERKGLQLAALDLRTADRSLAEEHYAECIGESFFGDLVESITGGPLVVMVVEGPLALSAVWQLAADAGLAGKTTPWTSTGGVALAAESDLVHASGSPEAAEREIKVWFPGSDLHSWAWVSGNPSGHLTEVLGRVLPRYQGLLDRLGSA